MNGNLKTIFISITCSLLICLVVLGGGYFYLVNHFTNDNVTNIIASESKSNAALVYEESKDGVLTVLNKKTVDPNNFFSQFFEDYTSEEKSYTQGVGSGFIFAKQDGYYYALTNNHVVKGSDEIVVYPTPENNQTDAISAEVIGTEENFDVAILRFKSNDNLTVLEFEEDNKVTPGEDAYALGSPFGEDFAGSISKGIINAPIRDFSKQGIDFTYIQTDAAINPGNSGGPLLNSNSKVVGMNTLKIASQEADNLGLAIPSSHLKEIIKNILLESN